jgi:hypothetical protein
MIRIFAIRLEKPVARAFVDIEPVLPPGLLEAAAEPLTLAAETHSFPIGEVAEEARGLRSNPRCGPRRR